MNNLNLKQGGSLKKDYLYCNCCSWIKAGSFLKFYIPQLVGVKTSLTYQKGGNIDMMMSINPGILGHFLHKIVQI